MNKKVYVDEILKTLRRIRELESIRLKYDTLLTETHELKATKRYAEDSLFRINIYNKIAYIERKLVENEDEQHDTLQDLLIRFEQKLDGIREQADDK